MPPASVAEYATHRPSGRKVAPVSFDECTPPKGAIVLSFSDSCHNEMSFPFATSNSSTSPYHDCGTCDSPAAGFVSRSGAPLPSAACEKMARSPSRPD
jgi:hypothetical protein